MFYKKRIKELEKRLKQAMDLIKDSFEKQVKLNTEFIKALKTIDKELKEIKENGKSNDNRPRHDRFKRRRTRR